MSKTKKVLGLAFTAVVFAAGPSLGHSMFHAAENGVPVALVDVVRTQAYTEVHLETEAALQDVCWYPSMPSSPYLLANDQRYVFLGGDNIADCPGRQNYQPHDVMVLRFQPLPAGSHEFSLVQGQGGESQMMDPTAHRNERFWNFLHVRTN